MSKLTELGDFIRNIEYEVNCQVNGTKNLAYNSIDFYLEPGGTLPGKEKKKEETNEQP